MKKLLAARGMNSDMQYYEMVVKSFLWGLTQEGIDQFKAMPKDNKLNFLRNACLGIWESGLSKQRLYALFDLV